MIKFTEFNLGFTITCNFDDDIDELLSICNDVSIYRTGDCKYVTFEFDGELSEFIRAKNILNGMELL